MCIRHCALSTGLARGSTWACRPRALSLVGDVACTPAVVHGFCGGLRAEPESQGGEALGRNEGRGRMSKLLQFPEPGRQRGICAGPGARGLFEEDKFHVAGLWRVGEGESWGDIKRNPQKQGSDIYPRPHAGRLMGADVETRDTSLLRRSTVGDKEAAATRLSC